MGYPLPPLLYVEAVSACIHHPYPLPISCPPLFPAPARIRSPATPRTIQPVLSSQASPKHFLSTNYSNVDSIITPIDDDGGGEAEVEGDGGSESDDDDPFFCETESRSIYRIGDGNIEIEIEKIGENCRRIRSKIDVEASLQIVWDILTDYEGLADFIPGLAVSQLLEKRDNFARLFQIGQQNLAFGLKFNAKGIVDCYEKDLETLPSGQRRDIEFKMIEGDFKLFEGKWSIEQCSTGICEQSDSLVIEELHTTLSYVVDVEPKLWLPVRLIEGRVCTEIQMNLSCVREKAQRAYHNTLHPC